MDTLLHSPDYVELVKWGLAPAPLAFLAFLSRWPVPATIIAGLMMMFAGWALFVYAPVIVFGGAVTLFVGGALLLVLAAIMEFMGVKAPDQGSR